MILFYSEKKKKSQKGGQGLKTNATYFVNDAQRPLRYGEINLINPPRRRLRGEPLKERVEAIPVFCGFCERIVT